MNNQKIQMEDGVMATLHDQNTLKDFLKEKFPDGIKVEMPDMSLDELKECAWMKITGDFHNLELTEFWGKINNTRNYLEYAGEGTLNSEMKFTPDDYHLIMPEDTYANMDDNVAIEDLDWSEKAATTFAHVHRDDTRDMTVEITKSVESLQFLYIEGRPFNEVMNAAMRTGVKTEHELKQLLCLMDIHEKGLQGKPVPELVEPLIKSVIRNYEDLQSDMPKVKEQKIQIATELLLHRAGIINRWEGFNMTATFDSADNNKAARQVVDRINLLAATDNVHAHYAMAVRDDNKVSVTVNATDMKRALKVESAVRTDPNCLEWQREPYKGHGHLMSFLILSDGQAVSGYRNLENLHLGTDYKLKHTGVDGNIQQMKILDEPGKAFMYNLFTSEQKIHFSQDQKESGIYVHQALTYQQYMDSINAVSVKFIQPKNEPDKVFIYGRAANEELKGYRLNPQDTRVYMAALASKDESRMKIIRAAFASVYYKDAIQAKKQLDSVAAQRMDAKASEKQRIYDRIGNPELYGKVDDLHIRCTIDGKLQPGRPLKGFNITLSNLKADAALLEKEYLNYPSYFHESTLEAMAVKTFSDLLGIEESEKRSRGLNR